MMRFRYLLYVISFISTCLLASIGLSLMWQYTHPSRPEIVGAFPLRERWHIQLEGADLLGPATWNDTIYVCLGQQVYAIGSRDGSILWQRDLPLPVGKDGIFKVGNDVVCVAEKPFLNQRTGHVIVLDAATGQILWQDEEWEELGVSDIAIGDTTVFVSRLYALTAYDRLTGARLWREGYFNVPILTDTETVYVFTDYITAHDARSGERQGMVHIPRVPSTSLYHQGIIYACVDDSWMAFDPKMKKTRWYTQRQGGLGAGSPPLVEQETLYAGDRWGTVYALDLTSGQMRWSARRATALPWFGNRMGTPVILNQIIYIRGEESGCVYALSSETGANLGCLRTHINWHRAEYRIATAGGLLIIPLGDNALYAYGP